MSFLAHFFYFDEFKSYMIENNIRDLLFTRLKILGYHLIRVKLINASGKKNIADYGREN